MRKFFTVAAVALLVSAGAFAQDASAPASIDVTAQVRGIFTFALDQASFDFGTVNANGTIQSGLTAVSSAPSADGTSATYTNNSGTVTWACSSAPHRTVAIALTSTADDFSFQDSQSLYSGTPDLTPNMLKVAIPTTSNGSGTWELFDATSPRTLISGQWVGNGNNSISGDLDLQLTVEDTTPIGDYTWTVRLEATGSL